MRARQTGHAPVVRPVGFGPVRCHDRVAGPVATRRQIESVITLQVRDANGNGVSGQLVTLGVTPGASLSQGQVTTGGDGRATFTVVAPSQAALIPNNVIIVTAVPVGTDFSNSTASSLAIGLTGTPNTTAPIPNFSWLPKPPQQNQTATFDATASLAEGKPCLDACTYQWTFDDGSIGSGRIVTHAFTAVQDYTVTLDMTNASGVEVSLRQIVTVVARPQTPPTAKFTFSPANPLPGQTVFFNAASSTAVAGHTLTSFAWDFGDGTTASGGTPSHSYAAIGTFTVTLTVTDEIGEVGVTANPVLVAVTPPTPPTPPVASFTFGPPSPKANVTSVLFDGGGSKGSNLTYTWNFGDGTNPVTSANSTINHVYVNSGAYSATLRVTDTVTGLNNTSAPQTVTVVP